MRTTVELILTERELLLGLGEQDGVKIGQRFAVLGRKSIHRENHSPIEIEFPKTIVKIVRFQGDHYAIGRTFRTIKGNPGMSFVTGTPDRVETLKSGEEAANKAVTADDRQIRIGDTAVQTSGDEYFDID